MPTTIVSVSNTWQLVHPGPQAGVLLSAISRRIYFQVVSSQPAPLARGHILNGSNDITTSISGQEDLWARTAGAGEIDEMAITS